jgi:hypothetical protein
MNLFDELNKLVADTLVVRNLALEKAYEEIQKRTIDELRECAKKCLYNCEIIISEFFCDDYYNCDYDKRMKGLTPIGANFKKATEETRPNLPITDELEAIYVKLEQYLISQGLEIKPLSHCHMGVSWAPKVEV